MFKEAAELITNPGAIALAAAVTATVAIVAKNLLYPHRHVSKSRYYRDDLHN
jgi:hypothetical protein